ncbi:hypothetical protein [Actinoplanes sp. G11-F43]|uniref:hypothetical protein n=1 Tax=Actinoplanes sp. G11-F43 TaxID=3424130 RepID=UPI003D332046
MKHLGLVIAIAATAVLIVSGGDPPPAGPPPQIAITSLAFRPLLFLDTRTAVGTAASDDDRFLRLLRHSPDGSVRELRRAAVEHRPVFNGLIVAGDDIVWSEADNTRMPQIWAASGRGAGKPRLLTEDAGDATLYGSEYDLVHHDGRVYWTARTPDGTVTEIRSVALTGGRVEVTRENGEWTLGPWPWLDDGASDGAAATLMRNRDTGQEITVPTAGAEFAACSPTWCRVMVLADDDLARIDVMRPDGSQRRRIAGGTARTGVPDVAILDRFEILAEPGPESATTGTAALLLHDLGTGDTVELAPDANDAQSRDGFVWWYGSDARWRVLDLRTV